MKAGGPEALPRAEIGARRMRAAGLDLEATIVGDPDPVAAVGDALRSREFDEVIVSTLPRGVSRWLRLSLPHRLRRMTDVPVLHVTAHPRAAAPTAPGPGSWRDALLSSVVGAAAAASPPPEPPESSGCVGGPGVDSVDDGPGAVGFGGLLFGPVRASGSAGWMASRVSCRLPASDREGCRGASCFPPGGAERVAGRDRLARPGRSAGWPGDLRRSRSPRRSGCRAGRVQSSEALAGV